MAIKKRGTYFIFNGKKGLTHELFFNVFELVLAAIVIIALFNFVNGVARDTIYEENFLARDLSILANTLYFAPGNVSYAYNENAENSKFTFNFIQNKVEAYGKEDEAPERRISYPFAENKEMVFRYNILTNELGNVKFEFLKTSEYVGVSKPNTVNTKTDSLS